MIRRLDAWGKRLAQRQEMLYSVIRSAKLLMHLRRWWRGLILLVAATASAGDAAGDGNRLAYLASLDPYYVSCHFPKLVTPQWVGEEGVEAVVILAIDDMRGHEKWEAFLRPLLERLKKIDGRAPVSIMTNRIDPTDPHLQKWLAEGLSLEVHTLDHPCPLLKDGDFAKAKATYDGCVDMMASIPGNQPVAFRMPCCDSLNSVSPRFFAEIFNQTTAAGRFLAIDSSVFNLTTARDAELPRKAVLLPDGEERFRRYLPFDSFANTIEDYPYPYQLGVLCWEFPCVVPSDWEAQNVQKPNNPRTVRDLEAALDVCVAKQGTFNLVFHPHNWIRAEQVIELVDHATREHGTKVKFLNFREALDRLTQHALGGEPLRASDGDDNGVRLLDLDRDGYLDVVIGNERVRQSRRWSPQTRTWMVEDFPVSLVEIVEPSHRRSTCVQFGMLRDGRASLLVRNERTAGVWHYDAKGWVQDPSGLDGLELDGQPLQTASNGLDRGVRLRDLDLDGRCELLVANDLQNAVFRRDRDGKRWCEVSFRLPDGARFVDTAGRDASLRLLDLDDDLHLDVLFSNEREYGLDLFDSMETGWSRRVKAATRGSPVEIPVISRAGASNGAWFHSRHLWVQNEDTSRLRDLVDRRSFNELLAGETPRAKSPTAAPVSLEPRPGFQVELVASEPLVFDPVAFDWGPDGKLWVAEMRDYPNGDKEAEQSGGCIRTLEDTDGDGRYDRSTVFLDGLPYPNGVMTWRRGVMLTAAPDIIYAEDTDGDGRANVREVLYTGFNEGNPQHRANGFAWGLDNWIYGANGDSGGKVKSTKTGEVVDIGGRDFRIRPAEGLVEPQLGFTQFQRTRDDWGNWFGNNNVNPMWQYVLEDHYLKRNAHFAAPETREDVPLVPGTARVYPRSRTLERFNDLHTADRFTSACGAIIYRDELFGPGFEANMFVSEPVHNLVHREVTFRRGVTIKSRRAADEQRSEFLASTDNWFRPTMLRTGPDGALWIADMYRAVIEHPEWIPQEFMERIDVRAGSDMGRIYRVFPVGAAPRPIPRLDTLDSTTLVAQLESPNGWVRDKAQQLLVERGDKSAAAALAALVTAGVRPTARLHALCTLDGLDALEPPSVLAALGDSHGGVRRHAVRLSEAFLEKSSELGAALEKLVDDPDPQVRLQLAYTLGESSDTTAARALGRLAVANADDPFISAAVMSSATRDFDELAGGVLAATEGREPPRDLVNSLVALAARMDDAKALDRLLKAITATPFNGYQPWQLDALASLVESLDGRGISLAKLHEGADAELQGSLAKLSALFAYARRAAADAQRPDEERLMAVRLLGRDADERDADLQALCDLLAPQNPAPLQEVALETLAAQEGDNLPSLVLAGWRSYGPGLRAEILPILFRRDNWLAACLDAVESGVVLPQDFDAVARQRLLEHKSQEVRTRAAKLLGGDQNADRRAVIEAFAATSLAGDAARGKQVFERRCALCHRLGDAGHAIGPDLAALVDRSPQAMLVAVLDPNRAVEAKFVSYTAVTIGGLTHSGLLTNETATSVTLLGQEAKEQVVLRTDLEALESTGKSLMPEGLEKDLTPQDFADLMALIGSAAPAPKQILGNRPELVRPEALRRELFCLSSNCEIYGQTLRLEEVNGALGWWNSEDDHAVWTIEIPRKTRYVVFFDWSCDDESAGNSYLLEVAGQQLGGVVEGTGDWNTYRREKVGELLLEPGTYRLGIRANGKIKGALFDLKSVTLRPALSLR